jgi:hypothetical protein
MEPGTEESSAMAGGQPMSQDQTSVEARVMQTTQSAMSAMVPG